MTDEPIPEWAWKRAHNMAYGDEERYDYFRSVTERMYPVAKALARLISRTEQPPVDPDLLIAREAVAGVYEARDLALIAEQARRGDDDHTSQVQSAVAAIQLYRERGK